MELTFEEVQELLELLQRAEFERFELKVGDLHICCDMRGGTPASSAGAETATAAKTRGGSRVRAQIDSPPEPEAATDDVDAGMAEAGTVAVKSPSVGVFYTAPSPGAAPYVDVGSVVSADTTVAQVEVMKTFIAVVAGRRGTIRRVCVDNGMAVEYGQDLFEITTSV